MQGIVTSHAAEASTAGLPAQQASSEPVGTATTSAGAPMTLDVVVTGKKDIPVAGLQPEDFSLLDNGHPVPLASVREAHGLGLHADPPVEVFVVVDAVNMRFLARANQRQWLMDFFNANGKELALPTSLVVLTGNGIEEQNRPTRDGNVLLRVLDASYAGFRDIKGAEGLQGALLREEESLKALNVFAIQQSKRPGRKLFIWLGGGWSVASNPTWSGGPKKLQSIYTYIALLSTALREAHMTLYEVIPASGVGRADIYMQYVKGVYDPKHADLGNLSLPVLATQTGGQVLIGSSDLPALIDQCISDVRSYYQLTFIPPPATHPAEYHALQVQLAKPGLKARTRFGYYTPAAQSDLPPLAAALQMPDVVQASAQ